jgi:uncharacterized protein YidB (DUF937 family)
MGIFDELVSTAEKVALQRADTGMHAALASAMANPDIGMLQGVVSKLQAGGLQTQVQSWLGSGANLPVTADQIRGALGDAHVQQIAQHFGLPVDQALQLMTQFLPQAVDHASQTGALPAQS